MAKAKKSPLNPKVIGIAIVVLLVVGVGAFFAMGKKDESGGPAGSETNAFTSIRDALSKSLSLQCEFTDEQGVVSKVYIKNGAMRGDFTGATVEESGSVITKGQKMYFWNSEGGYTMTLPEGDMDHQMEGESNSTPGEDFMKEIEEYKESCKPAVVADSLFTPPGDVTFTDMSQMMEGLQNGAGMNEQDLQKMMEQYQTQE